MYVPAIPETSYTVQALFCRMFWSVLIALASISPSHDFHVSRCDIFYRTTTATLEIVQHVFIDDLELALEEGLKAPVLHIGTELEHDSADHFIQKYLSACLKIRVEGSPVICNYLGKELEDDLSALWIYLEVIELPTPVLSMSIENTVLFELFDDQKNILSVKSTDSKDQVFLLDRSKPQISAQFQ